MALVKKQIRIGLKKTITLSAVCLLVGCASKPAYNSKAGKYTTITQQKIITNSQNVPNRYQVRSGDTVAKIAQRYGLQWREISRLNNLDGNHTIYVGQWLTLWVEASNNQKPTTYKQNPTRVQTPQTPVQPKPPIQPTPAVQPTVAQQSTNKPKLQPQPSNQTPFLSGSVGVMQFIYPVGPSNPVVRRFGTADSKGLTKTTNGIGMWFFGRDGDKIVASRSGTVIHADDNHVMGTTVSIQHTDGFISSYVHIKDATVKAGETVKAGQQIASMRRQEHQEGAVFEFRISHNNVYIDPLTVLK